MDIITIIIVALLCEAIWETAKMSWQDGKISVDRIGALVVCVFIALIAGVDLFTVAGIPLTMPLVGKVLTGVLISRGANFIHDLYKRMEAKDVIKDE